MGSFIRFEIQKFGCRNFFVSKSKKNSFSKINLLNLGKKSSGTMGRGTDGRVLPRPGDAIPPAGCFTRRSLPPIYIRGTTAPLTADSSFVCVRLLQ